MKELLDQISVEPRLFIKGKPRYTTNFGVILTFLVYSSVVMLSCYFLNIFIHRKEINVISFQQYKDVPTTISLKYLFFRFHNDDGETFDPRIASVYVTKSFAVKDTLKFELFF